jgi:hypothetical protein
MNVNTETLENNLIQIDRMQVKLAGDYESPDIPLFFIFTSYANI